MPDAASGLLPLMALSAAGERSAPGSPAGRPAPLFAPVPFGLGLFTAGSAQMMHVEFQGTRAWTNSAAMSGRCALWGSVKAIVPHVVERSRFGSGQEPFLLHAHSHWHQSVASG
jgi:hypothetical protein